MLGQQKNRELNAISVVLPTYNRLPFLRRALDSVLAQSLSPQEVIVVDDGSTDNTAAAIENEYREVKIFRQDNAGVSAARNTGIKAAVGNWIALLDSDDEWLPTKLEEQIDALEKEDGIRLCHTDEIWIRNGTRVNQMKKHQKEGGQIFARCLPLCCISPSSAMLHRTIFDDMGFFDESLPACEASDLRIFHYMLVLGRFATRRQAYV